MTTEEKLAKAIEALKYYADESNYSREVNRNGYFDSSEWTEEPSNVDEDGGNRARDVLREIEGEG